MSKNWNWLKNDDNQSSNNQTSNHQSRGDANRSGLAAFAPFNQMCNQMYQDMLEPFMRGFNLLPFANGNSPMMSNMIFKPSIDISSTNREYLIHVEIPGVDERDIKVEISRDGMLSIYGERRQEESRQDKDYLRMERFYGSFQRTLALPSDVDYEGVEAGFRNGVLTVMAPRMLERESGIRRVEIMTQDNRGGRQNEGRQSEGRQSEERGKQSEASIQAHKKAA